MEVEFLSIVKEFIYEVRHYQTIVAALIGGAIAWKYNKSKNQLDKENAKRQLFKELNERYDSLNDHLETLVHTEFETERNAQLHGEKDLNLVWDDLFESDPTKQSKTITAAFDYICISAYHF